ncbi:MAG: hypothetical protein ACWA5R_08270 [bacterium]
MENVSTLEGLVFRSVELPDPVQKQDAGQKKLAAHRNNKKDQSDKSE